MAKKKIKKISTVKSSSVKVSSKSKGKKSKTHSGPLGKIVALRHHPKWPLYQFIITFLVLTIVFYLISSAEWFESIRQPILAIYSTVSAALLNIFGYGVSANGEMLRSADFSVSIKEGCDAIAPAILYAVSILVYPSKVGAQGKRHPFRSLGHICIEYI